MAALLPRHDDTKPGAFQLQDRGEGDPGAAADEDEHRVEPLTGGDDGLGRIEKGSERGRGKGVEVDRSVDAALVTLGTFRVVEKGIPAFGIEHRQTDR